MISPFERLMLSFVKESMQRRKITKIYTRYKKTDKDDRQYLRAPKWLTKNMRNLVIYSLLKIGADNPIYIIMAIVVALYGVIAMVANIITGA